MPNSYETREYAYYCPKCGQCHFITYGSNELCLVCKTKMIESPPKYKLTQAVWLQFGKEFEQNEQRLFDEVISKSPEFDINLYNNKDTILKQKQQQQEESIARGKAILEKQSCQPKCPICQSTNIKKITVAKRAFKTALFGFLGAVDDAGKTWQCEDCGSKF